MTNEQLYLAIGVPLVLNFIGLAGLYALISSKLDILRAEFASDVKRLELLLKLHEALHHPEARP